MASGASTESLRETLSVFESTGQPGGPMTTNEVTDRKERGQELERRVRELEVITELGNVASKTATSTSRWPTHPIWSPRPSTTTTANCTTSTPTTNPCRFGGAWWDESLMGQVTVSAVEADWRAAYALENENPVVVEDLETETRFSGPELLPSQRSGAGAVRTPPHLTR